MEMMERKAYTAFGETGRHPTKTSWRFDNGNAMQPMKTPLQPRHSKRGAGKFCPVPVCRQNCGCGGPRLVLSSDVGVGCRDGGCDSDYRLLLVIVESCDLC